MRWLGGREFHCGSVHGHAVVLVLSGIGKVAAATTAALLIHEFKARALVFTGVAGGLRRGVKVGDVVVAQQLLQHDMDASPLFPRFEVPLSGRSRFDADARLEQPRTAHAFVVRRLQDKTPWVIGRAGMQYRDLIPGRLGGSIIASHIRVPVAGPVPDMSITTRSASS